jgi:hypothetical protein
MRKPLYMEKKNKNPKTQKLENDRLWNADVHV